MTVDLGRGKAVADAVLYEGYVLYPYRASAQKNQVRWQWGVLMPRVYAEASGEAWRSVTEVLLEPRDGCSLRLAVRFLQAQARQVEAARPDGSFTPVQTLEVGDELVSSWDEGVEHMVDAAFDVGALLADQQVLPVSVTGGVQIEEISGGRLVRTRWPLEASVLVSAERLEGPYGVVKLRVETQNLAEAETGERDEALHHALIAAHTLLGVEAGAFISLLDHPEWAREAVASLSNVGLWPVLVGEEGRRDTLLASPIILSDHPAVAPESPGDLYDATEIDEILTLRTMALTEDEKREARGTDRRAAEVVQRVDAMPPELLESLHGTIREFHAVTGSTQQAQELPTAPGSDTPWWDPGADSSVSPETDHVWVGDVAVSRGSRVRLRPGLRRADAQDMFLAERTAVVDAVLLDVDDNRYLAVTLEDDPSALEFQWHGRFLYFHPDEVEAL